MQREFLIIKNIHFFLNVSAGYLFRHLSYEGLLLLCEEKEPISRETPGISGQTYIFNLLFHPLHAAVG